MGPLLASACIPVRALIPAAGFNSQGCAGFYSGAPGIKTRTVLRVKARHFPAETQQCRGRRRCPGLAAARAVGDGRDPCRQACGPWPATIVRLLRSAVARRPPRRARQPRARTATGGLMSMSRLSMTVIPVAPVVTAVRHQHSRRR
jgi:hypothetical protein